MDGVCAGLLGDLEDLRRVQIALGGDGRADEEGLVGEGQPRGAAVDLGVDRDRGDLQLATGPQHAQGDLPSVGDQHAVEHLTSSLSVGISAQPEARATRILGGVLRIPVVGL